MSQRISEREIISVLTGSEKIPLGVDGNKATNPDQLKTFISALLGVEFFKKDGSQAMEGDIDMNGNRIKQLLAATENGEAVTFEQLNAAIDGLKPKSDARAATTADITLSGEQTIDGVAVVTGDRVLVKDQSTVSENGLYLVDAGDWTRTTDADTGIELQGALVQVAEGTVNIGTAWTQYSIDITLETTDILWRQISSTIPDATPTTKGKAKLFTALGSGTDGAINQNVVTRTIQDSLAVSATATGTDTYAITLSPAPTAYTAGQIFQVKFTNANTGASTINVNGLGAKAIKKNVSGALVSGDIAAGQVLNLAYDGTNFQIVGGSVAAATALIAGIVKLYTALGSNTDGAVDQNTLTNELALKAPLASPGLTGTPTAPTASQGTNSTQLATTAFVVAAINALISAAPGALDTLDELAAALGDDANFAATITSLLALKAPLASPTFTGTPAAPTAALGTNTTQIATMAAVRQEVLNAATIANAGAKLYMFNAY